MTEEKPGYWYLHKDGSRIFKPAAVVEMIGANVYFDSPFVAKYWRGPRTDNRTPEERNANGMAS